MFKKDISPNINNDFNSNSHEAPDLEKKCLKGF
jgi:hypothetical protein